MPDVGSRWYPLKGGADDNGSTLVLQYGAPFVDIKLNSRHRLTCMNHRAPALDYNDVEFNQRYGSEPTYYPQAWVQPQTLWRPPLLIDSYLVVDHLSATNHVWWGPLGSHSLSNTMPLRDFMSTFIRVWHDHEPLPYSSDQDLIQIVQERQIEAAKDPPKVETVKKPWVVVERHSFEGEAAARNYRQERVTALGSSSSVDHPHRGDIPKDAGIYQQGEATLMTAVGQISLKKLASTLNLDLDMLQGAIDSQVEMPDTLDLTPTSLWDYLGE